MSLAPDDKITEWERAKLGVWDYPLSDKYNRINMAMLQIGSWEEALQKMDNFALIGEVVIIFNSDFLLLPS